MVDGYSLLLLLGLSVTVGALVVTLVIQLVVPDGNRKSRVDGVSKLSWGGLILTGLTALYHLAVGHAPGSPAALSTMGFLQEHPILPLLALLGVTGLLWQRRLRVRQRDERG